MHIIIDEHIFPDATDVTVRLVTPSTGASHVEVFFNSDHCLLITRASDVTSINGSPVSLGMSALATALLTATEFQFYNTTAAFADSTNRRYVTDAGLVVLGNTSGVNTGDETAVRIGALLTAETTPLDTDMVVMWDGTFMLKCTWANCKTFLKTYFDTLYPAGTRKLELPTTMSTTLKAVQDQGANVSPLMLSTEGVSIQPPALTGSSAVSAFTILQTWNTTGTPIGFLMQITDTASNAASLIFDIRIGSTSKLKMEKTQITAAMHIQINGFSLYCAAVRNYAASDDNLNFSSVGPNINIHTSSSKYFSVSKIISSATVELFRVTHVSGSSFITFGGGTSSFPAIKRNATALDIRLADDSGYADVNVGGLVLNKRLQGKQGAAVASANDLTLGVDGNLFSITGGTQIQGIATAGWQPGSEVTMIFTGALRIKHQTAASGGFAMLFNKTGADILTATGYVYKCIYDGTYWYQSN